MLTLDSGILKDNIKMECKYYEIEEKCQEIVKSFCLEKEENQKIFQDFASNYHTFRPFFDFVVCVLGYKILNPQMEQNKILVGKENHMYVYKTNENAFEENFRYGLSDDKTLNVYPMSLDSSSFHDCYIDWNNHHILPNDMAGHTQVIQQILNMLLISNKEVCEEYLTFKSDISYFVSRYLPIIRFQADRQGRMIITQSVYRKKNITQKQDAFISDLLDNRYTYPSFLHDIEKKDSYDNSKDLSSTLSYDSNFSQASILKP